MYCIINMQFIKSIKNFHKKGCRELEGSRNLRSFQFYLIICDKVTQKINKVDH